MTSLSLKSILRTADLEAQQRINFVDEWSFQITKYLDPVYKIFVEAVTVLPRKNGKNSYPRKSWKMLDDKIERYTDGGQNANSWTKCNLNGNVTSPYMSYK